MRLSIKTAAKTACSASRFVGKVFGVKSMSDIVYKNFAFSTPFLRGFKTLKIPIVDDVGAPAWPELFPLDKIDSLRDTVGARYFASQMLLQPMPMERIRLDPGAMHFYDDEFDARNARIGDACITSAAVYWDPSMGKQNSDGSVCVIIYRDDKNFPNITKFF